MTDTLLIVFVAVVVMIVVGVLAFWLGRRSIVQHHVGPTTDEQVSDAAPLPLVPGQADEVTLLETAGTPPADNLARMQHLLPQIHALLRQKNKIGAIKIVRDSTGLGLKESKDLVDSIERTGGY